MADRGKRTGRAEWKKRVARWGESGLSAEEFAAEIGVNAGTLRQWKYALNREERGSGRRAGAPGAAAFVEVTPATATGAAAFQLDLGAGRRLHIPSNFDDGALRRLLSLLERT